MEYADKTKEQLIIELGKLRQRISDLEAMESECKNVEVELKKYKYMVESANDAIFYKDLKSRYIIANNKTLEAFGLSREEVIGKNDYELMPDKEEAKINIEDDQIVFNTGKPKEITKHMKGADGKEYWSEAIKVPQFDNDGNIIGLVGIARDITERKRMEEALQIEKAYFEQLFESAPEAIILTTNDSRVIRVNKEFTRMFGYTNEEAKGKAVDDLVAPEDLREEAASLTEKIEKGEPIAHESVRKRKDGTQIDVSILGTPIKIIDGQIATYAIYRDITDRKKAEEKLLASEEKYRTLTENLNVGIYRSTVGPKGKAIEVNPAMVKIFGYESREEFLKINLSDVYKNPEDRKKFSEKMLRDGYVRNEELQYKRKDGTPFIGSDTAVAVKDEKGNVIYYDGIIEDITERKNVEKTLRESEDKYRTLTENLNVGIFRSTPGPKGKFLEVNPAMLKIFGFENKEEFLAINVSDLYQNPENRARFNERMLKDGFVKNEESVSKKKDGTIFIASDTAIAVKDEKGNVLYYDGIVEDITERKKLEEERLNRSKLEAINKMVVTINHEMNQPLTVICSNTEVLLKEIKKDSKIYKDLKIINKAAWRLADLIRKTQRLREIKTSEYAGGIEMINLSDNDA